MGRLVGVPAPRPPAPLRGCRDIDRPPPPPLARRGTNVRGEPAGARAFSCWSGLMASRSAQPFEASIPGPAGMYSADWPTTVTPLLRSDDVRGSVRLLFLSRTEPSSDAFST